MLAFMENWKLAVLLVVTADEVEKLILEIGKSRADKKGGELCLKKTRHSFTSVLLTGA